MHCALGWYSCFRQCLHNAMQTLGAYTGVAFSSPDFCCTPPTITPFTNLKFLRIHSYNTLALHFQLSYEETFFFFGENNREGIGNDQWWEEEGTGSVNVTTVAVDPHENHKGGIFPSVLQLLRLQYTHCKSSFCVSVNDQSWYCPYLGIRVHRAKLKLNINLPCSRRLNRP